MSRKNTLSHRLAYKLLFLLVLLLFLILFYYSGEQWLRTFLLYLSAAAWARTLVTHLPLARPVVRRFVAGESIDEAMAATQALNQRGMLATLDYLGESVTSREEAFIARDEILNLLDQVHQTGVQANVSLKLSQLGLKIDPALTRESLVQLLTLARETNNKIRLDMEESALVDITLDIYRWLREEAGFENVGVVIQAYLYRSEADVRRLVESGAWVR